MDFEPTIVYKASGPHQRLGGTFDYKGVNTQEEFDAAIEAGWYPTLDEAVATKLLQGAGTAQLPSNDAPPTRAELEQKATELGLKFDGRTSDKKLGEMIAEALKG